MQSSSDIDLLSKQRKDIVTKYHNGPTKSKVDDWENPQYSIYATTDYYGFIHDRGFSDDFLLKETKIKKMDCKRETKWRKLLDKKSETKTSRTSYIVGSDNPFSAIIPKMNDSSFREEITKRVYKGIPQKFKSSLWPVFLGINSLKDNKSRVYQTMLKKALDRSPDVYQIDLDVNRTFRNTTYFRERYNDRQKALLHVLSAYSMYNTEIGYCQGMSEIGGLLLMYLVEEEDVFWGLSQLMTSPRWCMHGMFAVGFPRLLTFFNHLNVILQRLLPKIAKHFEKLELMSSAYALKWFMQCFLDRVPFTLFLRVWDIYLLEGEKLLIAMAYNILKMHKKRIIKMDHCSVLQFFQCDLRRDFLYDDDFVVESLKACIEELLKHKLSVPPPTQSHELPTRPFGSDMNFLTPSLSVAKERQKAQANPEQVLRRSIKKQRDTEIVNNLGPTKSVLKSNLEEKNLLPLSKSREENQPIKNDKSEIDSSVPSHIRYRIDHKTAQINKSTSLYLTEDVNRGSQSSLEKTRDNSKSVDRQLIKSVPDLSNKVSKTTIKNGPDKPGHRKVILPESKNRESNHFSDGPIADSHKFSSINGPMAPSVKRTPQPSSQETAI